VKLAEERRGRATIEEILRALVGPTLRGCLGSDREGSTAARFMIRASIESVPPIRRIKNREIDHLRKFAAAMRRTLPGRDEAELYWGLHFALSMAHHTIREKARLAKLSRARPTMSRHRRPRGRCSCMALGPSTGEQDASADDPARADDAGYLTATSHPGSSSPGSSRRNCAASA
jgi:hypothetical protein